MMMPGHTMRSKKNFFASTNQSKTRQSRRGRRGRKSSRATAEHEVSEKKFKKVMK